MDRSELKARDVGNVGSGRTGHVFLIAVLAATLVAMAAAIETQGPPAGAPAYALNSGLVYRLEVGLVVFVALYVVVVIVRLASHGLTPSRVGTAAVDLPQLAMSVGSASHMLGESETVLEGVYALLADQEARLAIIEHALSGDADGPKG